MEPLPLATSVPVLPREDPSLAAVHIYAWGDELQARAICEIGLGLTKPAAAEVIRAGLPVSVLCDPTQADAVAALLLQLGGSVAVTPEPGLGMRLLARMSR
jgi:hypothetical protein